MGYQVGKRYTCGTCGTQGLVSRLSEVGELKCCDVAMMLQAPKKLASSD